MLTDERCGVGRNEFHSFDTPEITVPQTTIGWSDEFPKTPTHCRARFSVSKRCFGGSPLYNFFLVLQNRWKKTITMSDAGSNASNAPEQVEQVEVADNSGPMSVEQALEEVVKTALVSFWVEIALTP